MPKYILEAVLDRNCLSSDGYYTGGSFTYQGARYAIVERDVAKAKVYLSEKRALNACKMGFENYSFQVKTIED